MISNYSVTCDLTEDGNILGYFLSKDGEVTGYYNDRKEAINVAKRRMAREERAIKARMQ